MFIVSFNIWTFEFNFTSNQDIIWGKDYLSSLYQMFIVYVHYIM